MKLVSVLSLLLLAASPAGAACPEPMREYRARVVEVHDGDTVRLDVMLGFGFWSHGLAVRLEGIDTPELPSEAGKAARDALRALLPVGRGVLLRTCRDAIDKYGRQLGTLVVPGVPPLNVNEHLVAQGYAKPYSGGKR